MDVGNDLGALLLQYLLQTDEVDVRAEAGGFVETARLLGGDVEALAPLDALELGG